MYNDLVDIAAWRDFRENLRAISVSCCRHGRHSAGEWEREAQSVYLISLPLFGMPGLCCFFRHVWPSASPFPFPRPACVDMWCACKCGSIYVRMWHIYYATVTESQRGWGWDLNESAKLVFFLVLFFCCSLKCDNEATAGGEAVGWQRGGRAGRASVKSRRSFLFIRLPAQLPHKQCLSLTLTLHAFCLYYQLCESCVCVCRCMCI